MPSIKKSKGDIMKRLPDYEDYKKMIIKRALSFSRSTGVATDELISVGNLCFVESWKKYDAKRGKYSTYLWRCLTSSMSDFVKHERKLTGSYIEPMQEDESDEVQNEVICARPNVEHDLEFRQQLGILSPMSAIAVKAILSGKIKEGIGARGLVTQFMHKEGASWPAVWQSMREIKSVLQEA